MTTVYVRERGAVIRKQGERLRVMSGDRELLHIPLADLTQLVLMGNVQLTTPSAIVLLRHDVDVVFMSYNGAYYGRLNPNTSKYADLRHKQLRLCDDAARSLALARRIVIGKVTNQRVVLMRRSDDLPEMTSAVQGMMAMYKAAEGARDLDQLRGYEGKAAAYHFAGLRLLVPAEWGFETRQYYPPPDPFNALLSFVYTLLRKDVEANLQLTGLDAYLGFFHTLGYDRPALALDLMEEFRAAVGDLVVLNLVRGGAGGITLSDFRRTSQEDTPIRMSDSAAEKLVAAYEQRLEERAQIPGANEQTSYRRIIELQARLARIVRGEAQDYQPLLLR
ncbi:MAG: CRISPR-associated endonuclease Cas1 [Anaerolinea sp.]|nr:CRISPR-associated endonuclease Cas1 [Anaerolinea sp.]